MALERKGTLKGHVSQQAQACVTQVPGSVWGRIKERLGKVFARYWRSECLLKQLGSLPSWPTICPCLCPCIMSCSCPDLPVLIPGPCSQMTQHSVSKESVLPSLGDLVYASA